MFNYFYALTVWILFRSVGANVRWYAIGDWGYEPLDIQERVAEAMNTHANGFDTEFLVALGDNFYTLGIGSVDDPKVDLLWRDVYNMTNLHQDNLGWWVVVGDVDYGLRMGEEWNQVELSQVDPLWNMPHLWYDNVWSDGTTDVHIIFIDTMALNTEMNNHTVMLDWLNQTLAQTTADWVLVAGHHPVFSCGLSGPVIDFTYEQLMPVLDHHKYTVDMYLAGHDHNVQLLQKVADPGHFDFVISGAAGAPPFGEDPDCQLALDPYGVNKTFMEVTPAFAVMEASSNWLNITYVDTNQDTLYTYCRMKAINKRDKL